MLSQTELRGLNWRRKYKFSLFFFIHLSKTLRWLVRVIKFLSSFSNFCRFFFIKKFRVSDKNFEIFQVSNSKFLNRKKKKKGKSLKKKVWCPLQTTVKHICNALLFRISTYPVLTSNWLWCRKKLAQDLVLWVTVSSFQGKSSSTAVFNFLLLLSSTTTFL